MSRSEFELKIPTKYLIKNIKSYYNHILWDVTDHHLNDIGVYYLLEIYDDVSETPSYVLQGEEGMSLAYSEYGDPVPDEGWGKEVGYITLSFSCNSIRFP